MMNTFFAYNICLNKNIAGLNLGLHSQISQFSTMVVAWFSKKKEKPERDLVLADLRSASKRISCF